MTEKHKSDEEVSVYRTKERDPISASGGGRNTNNVDLSSQQDIKKHYLRYLKKGF